MLSDDLSGFFAGAGEAEACLLEGESVRVAGWASCVRPVWDDVLAGISLWLLTASGCSESAVVFCSVDVTGPSSSSACSSSSRVVISRTPDGGSSRPAAPETRSFTVCDESARTAPPGGGG